MSEQARGEILGRLRAVAGPTPPDRKEAVPDFLPKKYSSSSSSSDRVLQLRRCMEAARTEFLDATAAGWPDVLHAFLVAKGVRRMAYGPGTEAGRRLAAALPAGGGVSLVPYDRPVEEMKDVLFSDVDAGFTTVRCAIAATGSLVLWPSPKSRAFCRSFHPSTSRFSTGPRSATRSRTSFAPSAGRRGCPRTRS